MNEPEQFDQTPEEEEREAAGLVDMKHQRAEWAKANPDAAKKLDEMLGTEEDREKLRDELASRMIKK